MVFFLENILEILNLIFVFKSRLCVEGSASAMALMR